jgi:hypothetical protein
MACLDFLCRRFARPGETIPEYPGADWVIDTLRAVSPEIEDDGGDGAANLAREMMQRDDD